jgi:ATPase subunit of ABC transporter with duplicated ATPase domains
MSTLREVLHIANLSKAFGPKVVLNDIHLSLCSGERAALVGENGAGKTTLAKIILGQLEPDAGQSRLAPQTQLGYLPQEALTESDLTIQAYFESALGDLGELRQQMEALETQLAAPLDPPQMQALLERYGDLQERYQTAGGYDLDYRREQVMAGLEIDYLDVQTPLRQLSGGEKTRVALAALLLRQPDLLILDEPTNHLDRRALAWLERYLQSYPGAVLAISHDRHFINQTVTQIIELSATTHTLTVYHGDYQAYLEEHQRRYESALAEFQAQREEAKRLQRLIKQKTHSPRKAPPQPDGDKLQYNARAENAQQTASKDIRDAKVRLERLQTDPAEKPGRLWRVQFDFQPLPLVSQTVIQIEGLSKAFAGRPLFQGLSNVIRKGQRVVIHAPNGAGKTTLLRILAGQLAPDAGEVRYAPGVVLGYLDQEQETLDLGLGVLDSFRQVSASNDSLSESEVLTALHRSGLFSAEMTGNQALAALSVGQRRKLGLARLIASRANVLLLDEPTNHLDLTALEALEAALLTFEGVILAASHDRWFTERIATEVWEW